jgi:FkbM family methyltransferase
MKRQLTALLRQVRKVPLVRYAQACWFWFQDGEAGRMLFDDPAAYFAALHEKSDATLLLSMRDGLKILIRRNIFDARIVREIFLEKPYVKHVRLAQQPTVIDVGGYIGDFSLYAVKHLGARHVFVFEPTRENFAILEQNIRLNGYGHRITAAELAVSNSKKVELNVQTLASQEMHSSSYWYQGAERRTLPALTLADILETNAIERVDLLKVDCEGGEYDIFEAVPQSVFDKIDNIVFEFHAIRGYQERLERLRKSLTLAGYHLRTDGDIVSATRVPP